MRSDVPRGQVWPPSWRATITGAGVLAPWPHWRNRSRRCGVVSAELLPERREGGVDEREVAVAILPALHLPAKESAPPWPTLDVDDDCFRPSLVQIRRTRASSADPGAA